MHPCSQQHLSMQYTVELIFGQDSTPRPSYVYNSFPSGPSSSLSVPVLVLREEEEEEEDNAPFPSPSFCVRRRTHCVHPCVHALGGHSPLLLLGMRLVRNGGGECGMNPKYDASSSSSSSFLGSRSSSLIKRALPPPASITNSRSTRPETNLSKDEGKTQTCGKFRSSKKTFFP